MILVGNSLGRCVQDILARRQVLTEGQKFVIVTSTNFEDVEEACAAYRRNYWNVYPVEEVVKTLQRVWTHIVQPGQNKPGYAHHVGDTYWFKVNSLEPDAVLETLIRHDESDRAGRASMLRSPRLHRFVKFRIGKALKVS